MSVTVMGKKTTHAYVSVNYKIAGGEPVIKGTRTRVMDIALRYEFMNMDPDEIIQQFPHLTLQQVHDALSYYYEHKTELDRKYREDQEYLNHLRKSYVSRLKTTPGT